MKIKTNKFLLFFRVKFLKIVMKTFMFFLFSVVFGFTANNVLPINSQKQVTGTITDNYGTKMPGVNVVIKDTSIGTYTDYSYEYYYFKPQMGTLLLFPSWLKHGSNQVINKSNERILISFNLT